MNSFPGKPGQTRGEGKGKEGKGKEGKGREVSKAPSISFDVFWLAYPRKQAKKDARKAWGQVKWTKEIEKLILPALENHKKSDQWREPQFVPLPATWLRGER